MCILYPLGIPLLFAALMRHERRQKAMKARYNAVTRGCSRRRLALTRVRRTRSFWTRTSGSWLPATASKCVIPRHLLPACCHVM